MKGSWRSPLFLMDLLTGHEPKSRKPLEINMAISWFMGREPLKFDQIVKCLRLEFDFPSGLDDSSGAARLAIDVEGGHSHLGGVGALERYGTAEFLHLPRIAPDV